MAQDLGAGWTTQAGTQYGRIFMLPEPREDGPEPAYGIARDGNALYDLDQAVEIGILKEVARARGDTQLDVARELAPISLTSIQRWWRGEQCPQGLNRDFLVRYLTQDI